MLEKCEQEEFQTFVCVARRIWLRRNEFLHEGSSHPNRVLSHAVAALQEYQQA
jgi:hypothetical protein